MERIMRKIIALLLAFCLGISLAACGSSKKAEEESIAAQQAAKEKGEQIYTLLTDAYNKVDEIGGAVYGVWAENVSSVEKKKMKEDPLGVLLPKTSLSKRDLKLGMICAISELFARESNGQTKEETLDIIHNGTEEEIEKLLNSISDDNMGKMLLLVTDTAPFCIFSVQDAYYLNGGIEFAQKTLESAKEAIKEAADMDVQPEGLESLKNIYVATSSYLDFCLNVDGSLLQASDKINGFTTTVKTAMAELELIY